MIGIDIRFLQIDEWPEIEEIEASCDWPIEDFDTFKGVFYADECVSLAGTYDDKLVAYAILEVSKEHISVARLAVDPEFRRKGIGTQMLNYIIGMSLPGENQAVAFDTCETNLPAHLFLKRNGFKAVAVVRDYLGEGRDAYMFAYGGGNPVPKNRLSLPI